MSGSRAIGVFIQNRCETSEEQGRHGLNMCFVSTVGY